MHRRWLGIGLGLILAVPSLYGADDYTLGPDS